MLLWGSIIKWGSSKNFSTVTGTEPDALQHVLVNSMWINMQSYVYSFNLNYFYDIEI